MTSVAWEQVKEVVHRALQLSGEQRAAFVAEACGPNTALRAEVDLLLSAGDDLNEDFLESPFSGEFDPRLPEFDPPGLAAGDWFANRYLLIRKLGEGGMGQVWLAEQSSPMHRPVALKLIGAGMYDEALAQRFHAERQSLAIMQHPCIAKVFDAGSTPQGQPYFVMEYVPGQPITAYCDANRLSINQRIELLIQACEGVQHAHQKAIIHRDLKPANILVVEIDGKAVPRIIDFGLAKTATPQPADLTQVTRFGQFMGTPGYMSPEQVDPKIKDIDTRADVYSLGVILYVLLTGVQPFESKRREQPAFDVWLRQLREQEPPRPSAKLGGDRQAAIDVAAARGTVPQLLYRRLRGDLDWIALKALERDRERRYGTPAELAADLRRHLNYEPVTARPLSVAYQFGKFVRRRRVATAAGAVMIALAVAASAAGLLAVRKQHEAEFQATKVLQAQARLLVQAATQHLKDADVAGARGIILEVLANPQFASMHPDTAISVFQDIRAADLQLAVLAGHRAFVSCSAYSPDGSRIVTASDDKTARIWDARTAAQLAVLSGHGEAVACAAFSPDGSRIVTASHDKTARIWDAHSGALLLVLSGHADSVNGAAFSPDGTRVVTASDDRTARIWDAHSGAQLAVLSGHTGTLNSAAYSPDGTRIVTASDDKTARIWDARSGAQLSALAGHEGDVNTAVFSPDGRSILTASDDRTARIWDASLRSPRAVVLRHGGDVNTAAFSPDGARIVTTSADRTARIWDVGSAAQLAVLSGHGDYLYSAVYSPDGTRIVTASDDRTARIWDAQAGAQLKMLAGHTGTVESVAYSPDGVHIVTASRDDSARVWDAGSGAQQLLLAGHSDYVYRAAYSPDGLRIVTASADKTARIWDARNGAQLRVLSGHGDTVYYASFSPDGRRVLTASKDTTARIWDAATGAQLAVLGGSNGSWVYCAVYSPDGTRIATASDDRMVRIWDADSGAQLAVLNGHESWVYSVAYSPDGARIVTGSKDTTVRIWDARSAAQLAVLRGHGGTVYAAVYSPDGKFVATAADDKTARIWDAASGAQLAELSGHSDPVESVAYSPDGTRIVTGSDDQTARTWQARVPADIDAQIRWDAAAEIDPLSAAERAQLGLPPDSRVRTWPATASECDRAAAAVYDPQRVTAGVFREDIVAATAYPACLREVRRNPQEPRLDYEMGRAAAAQKDYDRARRYFELAAAQHYRAANVDLADLCLDPAAGMLDPKRAVALYELAWQEGLPAAGTRLGRLYELGSPSPLAANAALAWQWYRRAAQAGDPTALARFAARSESSAEAMPASAERSAQLLTAFELYAAAAERSRAEDWPEGAGNSFRYHRALLARRLAGDGLMHEVADAYVKVRDNPAVALPAS